jgi:HK97 family phage major capsid protein
VHVTEELMTDSPAAFDALGRIVAHTLRGPLEKWLLRGNSVNEPLGILNAPSLIFVAAESSGNGAGTLVRQNLSKMDARCIADPDAFWVASPSAKGAMNDVLLAGGHGGAAGTLLGHPIVTSLRSPAVGTVGDCTLVAPSGFLCYTRGIEAQTTIYFQFDQGLASLRAYIRVALAPVLSAAVAPELDTANTVSHCVTTATRTG